MPDEKKPSDSSTDSPDVPESQSTRESPLHTGNTTGDLRKHAEIAMRLMREAGKLEDTGAMEAATEDNPPGNTTHDLQKAAQDAMDLVQAQKRLEQAAASHASDIPDMPFPIGGILRIDVVDSSTPTLVEVRGDLIIGRGDTVTNYSPEIDLTKYGAYRLGLSRRHAMLRRSGEYLELVDLGSRNGSHLNGYKLNPGESRRVKDGDEIQLGNLTLRLTFQPKA